MKEQWRAELKYTVGTAESLAGKAGWCGRTRKISYPLL